jgi:tripartite-type tricarboxylate transporter receptor subunit TctC
MSDEQKEIWKGIFLPEVVYGKAIIGPPNMPPEITKTLRDAFAAAVTDPQFAEGLEKIQGQPISLMRGEKAQELVEKTLAAFKAQLPRYNELRAQVYRYIVR